jgi:hypothetical protein
LVAARRPTYQRMIFSTVSSSHAITSAMTRTLMPAT